MEKEGSDLFLTDLNVLHQLNFYITHQKHILQAPPSNSSVSETRALLLLDKVLV